MSITEKLFWFITVPGEYIAISCLVYWIFLKIFKEYEEEDLKVWAALWVLTVPFFVVFGVPVILFNALFDMIGGEK